MYQYDKKHIEINHLSYDNDIYYKGFEGEPEIQFICRKGETSETFVIWEGYYKGTNQ